MAGEHLDMRSLAKELGISRATLYRWAGHREELLGDVLWSFGGMIHQRSARAARGRGAARILDTFNRCTTAIARSPELRRFLETDATVALRVLTMRDGRVQGRMVAAYATLIRDEIRRGAYRPRLDPDVLAYAIVRIAEAFIYNDAIVTVEPNLDAAKSIVRLLLR